MSCSKNTSIQEIREMDDLKRFKESQDVKVEWKYILDAEVYKLVMSQCEELSCAEELVVFPLLASAAHFMGTMATVKIDADWTEPVSLMCLLVARRGERKTCALQKMKQICVALDTRHVDDTETSSEENDKTQNSAPVQIIDEYNIKSDLQKTLHDCNGSPLIVIDDFKETVDSLEHSMDIFINSKLKELYGCGLENELRRRFNFLGTVQALDVHSIFENRNRIAMFDRSLIVCCKNSPETSKDGPVDSNSMQGILSTIRDCHSLPRDQTYSFDSSGQKELTRCLEIFQRMKRIYIDNKMVFGSINQAGGHLARLSAILAALTSGVNKKNGSDDGPTRSIDRSQVKRAYQIVRFVLQQKLCLFASKADDEWPEMTEENDNTRWTVESDNQSDRSMNVTTTGGYADEFDDEMIEVIPPNARVDKIVAGKSDVISKNFDNDYADDSMGHSLPENEMVLIKNHFQLRPPVPEEPFRNQMHSNRHEMDNRFMEYFVPITPSVPQMPRHMRPPQMSLGPRFQNGHSKSPHSSSTNIPSPHSSHNTMEKPKAKKVYRASQKSLQPPFEGCIYDADDEIFFQQCANKIKKLLLTHGAIVTASYACQYRLFPPVPMDLRQKSPRTSHPSWAATRFFERLEGLEIGTMHVLRGHSVRFLKETHAKMSDKGKDILKRLRISPEEYEDTFPETTVFDELKLMQMKKEQDDCDNQIVFNN